MVRQKSGLINLRTQFLGSNCLDQCPFEGFSPSDEVVGGFNYKKGSIEYNRICKGLLNLIDDLRAVDLGIKNSIKKGEILYGIPSQMTQLKTTPFVVRIAQRTEFLLQNLELDHQLKIETIKI